MNRHLHRCAPRPVDRMVTTPAGIVIGRAYVPQPQPMGDHAQQIQAALLEPRTARPLTPLQRLFGAFWRWL